MAELTRIRVTDAGYPRSTINKWRVEKLLNVFNDEIGRQCCYKEDLEAIPLVKAQGSSILLTRPGKRGRGRPSNRELIAAVRGCS